MKNIAFWIIFFLFGLPMIGVVMLQFFGAAMLSGVMYQVNNKVNEDRSFKPTRYSVEGLDRVLNASHYHTHQHGFRSLAEFDDLDAPRSINFNLYVQPRDLLKPGEASPDPDFEEIFLEARAGVYGVEECERLLKTLASKCAVKHNSVRKDKKDNKIRYRMSIRLSFVQKQPFGEVAKEGEVSYHEISTSDSEKLSSNSNSLSRMESMRLQEYKKVIKKCEVIRSQHGNCAIHEVEISQTSHDRLKTETTLTYLQ